MKKSFIYSVVAAAAFIFIARGQASAYPSTGTYYYQGPTFSTATGYADMGLAGNFSFFASSQNHSAYAVLSSTGGLQLVFGLTAGTGTFTSLTDVTLKVTGWTVIGGSTTISSDTVISGMLSAGSLSIVSDATFGGKTTLVGNTILTDGTTLHLRLSALDTSTSALALSIAANQTQIAALGVSTTATAASITALNTSVAALASSTSSFTTAVNASTASLTIRINNLNSSTATLTTRIGNLDSSTAAITTRVTTLETATATIRGFANGLSASTVAIAARVTSLEASTATLAAAVSGFIVSTQTLSNSTNTLLGITNALTLSTTTLGTSTATLKSRVDTIATSTGALATQISNLNTSTASLTTITTALSASTTTLGTSTATLKTRVDNLNTSTAAIVTLQNQINASTGVVVNGIRVSSLSVIGTGVTVSFAGSTATINISSSVTGGGSGGSSAWYGPGGVSSTGPITIGVAGDIMLIKINSSSSVIKVDLSSLTAAIAASTASITSGYRNIVSTNIAPGTITESDISTNAVPNIYALYIGTSPTGGARFIIGNGTFTVVGDKIGMGTSTPTAHLEEVLDALFRSTLTVSGPLLINGGATYTTTGSSGTALFKQTSFIGDNNVMWALAGDGKDSSDANRRFTLIELKQSSSSASDSNGAISLKVLAHGMLTEFERIDGAVGVVFSTAVSIPVLNATTATVFQQNVTTLKFADNTTMISATGALPSTTTVSYNLVVTTNGADTNTMVVTADAINIMGCQATSLSTAAALNKSGAGGLDFTTEASSTQYRVFVIANDACSQFGAILSSRSFVLGPVMPSGFTKWRQVGFTYNNFGSNITPTYTRGHHVTLFSHRLIVSVTNGTAGSVDITQFISSAATTVTLAVFVRNNGAGSTAWANVRMNGQTSAGADFSDTVGGQVVAANNLATDIFTLPITGSNVIYYSGTNVGEFELSLIGWAEDLP